MAIFIVLSVVAIVALMTIALRIQREQNAKWKDKERQRAAAEKKKIQIEENKKKNAREAAILKQKQLEEKYASSPLTGEIIQAITDGTGRMPEEITIYEDRVSGCTNSTVRTYDFRANRVPFFEPVVKFCRDKPIDEILLLRAQVAMATAINGILGSQYNIMDKAKRSEERINYSNGYFSIRYEYVSDHVIMRLKPTKNF